MKEVFVMCIAPLDDYDIQVGEIYYAAIDGDDITIVTPSHSSIKCTAEWFNDYFKVY